MDIFENDKGAPLGAAETARLLAEGAMFKVTARAKAGIAFRQLGAAELQPGRATRVEVVGAGPVRLYLTDAELAERAHRAEEHRLNTADPLRRYMNKTNVPPEQKLVLMERNLGFDRGQRQARKGHPLADRIEAFAETVRAGLRGRGR